jgi:DNA-binding transcriptional MerR regulator
MRTLGDIKEKITKVRAYLSEKGLVGERIYRILKTFQDLEELINEFEKEFEAERDKHSQNIEKREKDVKERVRSFTDEIIKILCNCEYSDLPLREQRDIENCLRDWFSIGYYKDAGE